MNGPWEHIMVPHLNISMPNIAFPITEETVKKVRDSGSELWLYNCGDERLNLGLYPWRVKAGGRFQWHYRYINADPWDDLDGGGSDTQYCLSLPGPDGPVPAVKSQMVREAVDDHRYIATLEQAIAAARSDAKKQAAVAKATRFLEELRAASRSISARSWATRWIPEQPGLRSEASSRTPTRLIACAGPWPS